CPLEPDSREPNQSEIEFMQNVEPAKGAPGQMAVIPKIDRSLVSNYDKLRPVSQTDFGSNNNRDNKITLKPNRYTTEFYAGDMSKKQMPDTVCEDLQVPEETKTVLAAHNSDKQAWIAFDPEGTEVSICYSP